MSLLWELAIDVAIVSLPPAVTVCRRCYFLFPARSVASFARDDRLTSSRLASPHPALLCSALSGCILYGDVCTRSRTKGTSVKYSSATLPRAAPLSGQTRSRNLLNKAGILETPRCWGGWLRPVWLHLFKSAKLNDLIARCFTTL